MSIREKEERLQNAARNWEQAAEEYKKAGEHRKAAEALEMAAMAWEDAEKAHPIGFINAIACEHARNEAERIRRIRLDPRDPRIGDN